MKILILSDYIENFDDKASYEIRYLTALSLAERGNDVAFISPKNKKKKPTHKKYNAELKILTSPGLFSNKYRAGGFSFIDALKKTKFVLKNNFDIIQATNGHRPSQFLPCIVGKYIKKAKIVDECWEWLGEGGYAENRVGIMGKLVGMYDRYFELNLKKFYDNIITISSELKNRFKNKDSVFIIHGGTQDKFFKDYNIYEVRKELNLDKSELIIGMSNVCSSDENDNKIFFNAFERVTKEHKNCYLLMTGTDQNYIKKIGDTYNISEKIIYIGYVNFELYNKYLSCCDFFVLPLNNTVINRGRWPNKIGDYLCVNRPIITNPTGDIKELINSFKVGVLCKPNSGSFYLLLKSILNKEIDLKKYNEDSLYVARELLSFEKRIDKFIRVFESD